MPGAVRTVASAPVIDDDLGIELHPPAGGYSTPHNQGWGQQPQSRGNTNWAVAISAIFVIIFIGMLVAVVSVGSKKSNDTPYMRAAIQAIDSKDYEDAITYCSLAISADPKSTAAYYLKGKLLLELMENRSDSFEKLVYLAKTGETSRLDEADDCFEQCILTTPSDENISVEYLDMTSAEVVGSSRIFMALTATLRAIANSHADHPDYARQWATIARQNIRYARQHNLSSKYDRLIQILENIASDYSR
ncbi:MAG: hypothetical protein ACOX3G_01860 [Armatimonadota bacterium]